MATAISWPPIAGAAFSIPAAGEVGWASLSNFLIALQNAQGTDAQKIAVRQATATPVNVALNDCVVLVNVAGPATVNLPVGINGQYYVINDSSGLAATNPITIVPNGSQTINGFPSVVININFNSYLMVFRAGTPGNWSILTSFNTIPSDIPRNFIAAASPNYVVINDGSGRLSEEAALSPVRGGMGVNASGFNGFVKADGLGNFSASAIITTELPSGIPATKIASGIVTNSEFDRLHSQGRVINTTKVQGGVVSINGGDPAKFDISSGFGVIVDFASDPIFPTVTDVTYGPFTAQTLTNLATNDITYILINSSGAIVQITTFPTPDQQRDNIFLCRINHVTRTTIQFVDNIGNNAQSNNNQLCDLMDALGPFNITGNTPAPVGANLTFQKSSGSMFNRYFNQVTTPKNPHIIPIIANSPVTFQYRTLNTTIGTNTTLIDPTTYDVGGTATAVPNPTSTATNQRIYLFPSNNVRIQYGQVTYLNLAAAVSGLATENFVINPSIAGFGILIGYISIQKNCLALNDTLTCKITPAARFDSGSSSTGSNASTLQQAYLNSFLPQIVLAAVQGTLQVRDNSTPLGTDLFAVLNNTASSNYFHVDAQGVKGSNFDTASRAIITDANKALGLSVVTSTELALLTGTVGVTGTVALVRSTTPTLNTPIIGGVGADPTYAAGKMWYDTADQTMRYYNDSTTDSVNIGQELNVKVRNTSGSPMTPGQVVRITGAVGGVPAVSLAQANSFANAKVFAVVTENIANNTNGYATISGRIKSLNLSAFSDGDVVYLSTSVAGGLTNVRPSAPNYVMPVGSVASNNSSNGILIVDFGSFRRIGLGTANQLRGVNAGATEEEYKTLSGTTNQITVTQGVGSITLALDPAALNSASGVNLIQYPSTYVNPPWAITGAVFTTTPPVTTSTAADLPLGGVVPTAIKITATGSAAETAQFLSYPVTTSAAMNGKLQIDLFLRPGTNFAANEWTLSVYQSSTRQVLSSDQSGVTYIPNNTGRFTVSVDVAASTAYTLRIARVSGGTNAVLNVCNVFFGIPFITQGAALSDWVAYTPTFQNMGTSPGTPQFFYRRNGSSMEIQGKVVSGNPNSGSGPVTFTLPSPYTVNGALQVLTGLQDVVYGTYTLATSAGPSSVYNASDAGVLVANGASTNKLQLAKQAVGNQYAFGAGTTIFPAVGTTLNVWASVPIAEWAGNGTVNLGPGAQVEYISTPFSGLAIDRSPAGTALPTTTPAGTNESISLGAVPWQYPQQVGDLVLVQIQDSGVGPWLSLPRSDITDLIFDGTNYLGLGISYSSGAYQLLRGKFRTNGSGTWASMNAGTRYRLVKATPSAPVGFGLAGTDGSSGLYKPGQAPGQVTGAAIASGYIGQEITATESSVALTAGTFKTSANTLVLTAGDWVIYYYAYFVGVASLTGVVAGLSTDSGATTFSDASSASNPGNANNGRAVASSAVDSTITFTKTFNITATTTYYPKAICTGANTTYGFFIKAVRFA